MKNVFKGAIARGGYSLPDMLAKIDSYHVTGQLTDQERDELYSLARGHADPNGNLDILAKLLEVMDAVKELQDRVAQLEQPVAAGSGDSSVTAPEEYGAGKWYRSGDRITYKGKVYVCSAPEGAVCTWNPDEYPDFWEPEDAHG